MTRLSVSMLLIIAATSVFSAHAKQVTRSCNYTVEVKGCSKLIVNKDSVRKCGGNITTLGSKSGSISGTAGTVYFARVAAKNRAKSDTKNASPNVTPQVSRFPSYPIYELALSVSGDAGCKFNGAYKFEFRNMNFR